MAALHAITRDMAPSADRSIQFKSPDYQRSMTGLHETVADYSDYEKFRVFLEMEKNAPEALASLTGVAARSRIISKKKEREMEMPKKNFNFIPYIKAKLIWS
jgi:hypothetical protein